MKNRPLWVHSAVSQLEGALAQGLKCISQGGTVSTGQFLLLSNLLIEENFNFKESVQSIGMLGQFTISH